MPWILALFLAPAIDAQSAPTAPAAEDIRIQQYGDTAVVAFRLVGTMGSGPQAVITQFLNTGTFVKRGGEWRAVAWQSTRVPEPEEGSTEPQCPEPKKVAAISSYSHELWK